MDDKKRLQFDFSDPAVKQLDELVTKLGANSRAEVIRQSLRLLSHFVEMRDEKAVITAEFPDGKKRELLPMF